MKSEKSIDRIIQVNGINIGKNLAQLRKSMHIKQIEVLVFLHCLFRLKNEESHYFA